jgi:hypothetical protein
MEPIKIAPPVAVTVIRSSTFLVPSAACEGERPRRRDLIVYEVIIRVRDPNEAGRPAFVIVTK